MSQVTDELEQRQQELEREGADPRRLRVLQCARAFKRSWVDMARALVEVRQARAYADWGYDDLYAYCREELLIKSHTVDKLTGSYVAIQRHAPAVLEGGSASAMPSVDAVDYFARALGERHRGGDGQAPEPRGERPEPPAAVIEELRQAVFEDNRPVSALRRKFHETLFPKSPDERQQEAVRSARRAARRLAELLARIEGLSRVRVQASCAELDALAAELDRLLPEGDADASSAGSPGGTGTLEGVA